MKKVGITGQNGFVGRHLFNFLNLKEDIELIPFNKSYFKDENKLNTFVQSCDVIVHLAAMNRHSIEQVIYDTNIELVTKLLAACKETDATPKILFSSSTQQDRDNLYGKSKLKGSEMMHAWAKDCGADFLSLVIPNVFGPFGKPFYNSVVATFCHQLTNNEQPAINNDGLLNLIYVNELIDDIYNLIQSTQVGEVQIQARHQIMVSDLLTTLVGFREDYLKRGEIPNIDESPLKLALFNTFRCYVPNNHYPVKFTKHTDDRGSFTEIVRAKTSGQFSFSTTKPSITRGNHFHTRKAERFAVIKGKAKIAIRKIDSDDVVEYVLDGEEPSYVDMPIWHTHNITNIGDEELLTLFWINEPYNQQNPDTYFVTV